MKKVERKERRRRAEEALAAVRLEGYGARRPHQLSGGQRQRVALARALVNRPKVLLLDEPLGALDLKLRREMQVELKEIQRDVGITFVFVTHDQEEALSMSDRVAVFNDGRVEQVATPVELYEQPGQPVRRRLRRHLQPDRAARPRGRCSARDGEFAVRPEKLRGRRARRRRSTPDEVAAPGRVREVVYLGPSTHAHRRARRRRRASPCRGPTAARSADAAARGRRTVPSRVVFAPRPR